MRTAELLLVLAPLATPVASAAPEVDDGWERVLPGHGLDYPRDHGAHPSTRIEWWYLTGQVRSESGRRFGFQLTVFRRGMEPGAPPDGASPLRARQVLAGHLALTDVENGRTLFAERLRRASSPLARLGTDDLDVALEGWSMRRTPEGRLHVRATDAQTGVGLVLELAPAKPLVLHGERGVSKKGAEPGNASAYASWTRLATSGELTLGEETHSVRGESWFDHEFGTSVLEEGTVGWDWFGLHLDDGRDLMLFGLRREDGGLGQASAGTLVRPDGSTSALAANDFRIEPAGAWTSPRNGAVYPSGWTIRVPGAGIEVSARPLVLDCELGAERSSGVAYWEGPVELEGTVGGRGYAELTGYAGTMAGRL